MFPWFLVLPLPKVMDPYQTVALGLSLNLEVLVIPVGGWKGWHWY